VDIALYDRTNFACLERLIKGGIYVTPEELATAVSANPDTVLPDLLRNYQCALLRGEIKIKTGRKRISISEDMLLWHDYMGLLLFLQERKKDGTLSSLPWVDRTEWSSPLDEIAARVVGGWRRRNLSATRVLDRVKRQKRRVNNAPEFTWLNRDNRSPRKTSEITHETTRKGRLSKSRRA
jgi:hypothetical protein